VLLKQGNYGAALKCIDKIITLRPTNMYYLRHKIDLLIRLEEIHQIIEYCDKAIIIDPPGIYFYELKIIYLAKCHKQETINCCDELLRLDSGNSHAYSYKIAMLVQIGRTREALDFVTEETDKRPQGSELYVKRIQLLSALGRNEEAIVYCNEIMRTGTVTTKVLIEKIEILNKLGKYQEASRCINDLLDLSKVEKRCIWYDVSRRNKLIQQVNKGVLVNKLRFRVMCLCVISMVFLILIILNYHNLDLCL